MELLSRPYVAAGVALAAGSLIAVAPVAAPLPGVQVSDIQLTAEDGDNPLADALQALFIQQLHSNSDLITNYLTYNGDLVEGVHGLRYIGDLLPGGVDNQPLANDAAAHLVQSYFQLIGAGEASNLGLLGANGTFESGGQWASFYPFDPASIYSSLFLTGDHAPNVDGLIPGAAAVKDFGGLEGAIAQYLVFGSEAGNLAGRDFVDQALFDSLVGH